MSEAASAPSVRRLALVTIVTASAAIIYELLIGTLSTYLHGDSALQYSVTIGVFLAAMGAGAWLARDAEQRPDPVGLLVRIEIAVAPSAAVVIGICTTQCRSAPSRSKISWGCSSTST